MLGLPPEVLELIVRKLGPQDIEKVIRTCKALLRLVYSSASSLIVLSDRPVEREVQRLKLSSIKRLDASASGGQWAMELVPHLRYLEEVVVQEQDVQRACEVKVGVRVRIPEYMIWCRVDTMLVRLQQLCQTHDVTIGIYRGPMDNALMSCVLDIPRLTMEQAYCGSHVVRAPPIPAADLPERTWNIVCRHLCGRYACARTAQGNLPNSLCTLTDTVDGAGEPFQARDLPALRDFAVRQAGCIEDTWRLDVYVVDDRGVPTRQVFGHRNDVVHGMSFEGSLIVAVLH